MYLSSQNRMRAYVGVWLELPLYSSVIGGRAPSPIKQLNYSTNKLVLLTPNILFSL